MSPTKIETEKGVIWRARVYRNGRSYSLGAYKNERAAKDMETDKHRELDRLERRGMLKSTSTFTLSDLVEKKLEQSEKLYVPTTTKNLRNMGRIWLDYFGPDRLLESITSDDIKKFLNTKGKGKKNSNKCSNTHLKFLMSLWRFGIKERMIEEDIFSNITPLPVNEDENKLLVPSQQEIKTAVEWCYSNGEDYIGDFLTIMVQAGVRGVELTNLKWEEVDLDRQTLRVWTKKSVKQKNVSNTIGVHPMVIEILIKRKERQKTEGIKSEYCFEWNTDGISKDDPQWYVRPYNMRYKKLQKVFRKSGMEKTTFHKLRHLFSIRMNREHVSRYDLSKLLGHKNPATTNIYLRGKIRGEKVEHHTNCLDW